MTCFTGHSFVYTARDCDCDDLALHHACHIACLLYALPEQHVLYNCSVRCLEIHSTLQQLMQQTFPQMLSSQVTHLHLILLLLRCRLVISYCTTCCLACTVHCTVLFVLHDISAMQILQKQFWHRPMPAIMPVQSLCVSVLRVKRSLMSHFYCGQWLSGFNPDHPSGSLCASTSCIVTKCDAQIETQQQRLSSTGQLQFCFYH